MERVHFQQEQMLDELKDLVEKNLFTEQETKMIMKKRTAFESSLVRRVAKKADYLRYAAYEMGLEQLRRKRVARMQVAPGPATVSDYALVRRQFHIFERAVKKFKSDVGLWVQYIEVAKREGARALVGRITARALQLHPNKPALFIIAASHELDQHSPSAARVLMQRGIRLNPESLEMWKEYVKMELGFIESLRRRWDVLGIKLGAKEEEKEDASELIVGEGISEKEVDKTAEMDGEYEKEEARRKVMDGAIVASVISSAAQAIPRVELFECIKEAICNYPSPGGLRQRLLDHLYEEARRRLPGDARMAVFVARRQLGAGVTGSALVEGIRTANEELAGRIRETGAKNEELCAAYMEFLEEWCGESSLPGETDQGQQASLRRTAGRAPPAAGDGSGDKCGKIGPDWGKIQADDDYVVVGILAACVACLAAHVSFRIGQGCGEEIP
ncbi:U3 small nucleolar RNA-associated protein 6 [Psilocybe cubensis]|uniref:U3 small nucleolar RNA-associated protein 6 n=2 Tax=Psilocybe cubensis TaxID=181762 RepID=A0ACB8HBF1_PSICU|nr:U3 small nucleolar RNA-associated protein 6 [Psilocybe cubensis]KAH9485258.1 U3 small nucleolar RNA-associated protein 6 [Psilocybe cubensis]